MRAQGVFDPAPPDEPTYYNKYKVTVTAEGSAYTSGSGTYKEGTSVYISTSTSSSSYIFLYWKKDGVKYSTSKSFYYTANAPASFVAVYEFEPPVPSEPSPMYKRSIYLTGSPANSCSFNYDYGSKVSENSNVAIRAYANTGYKFLGWYSGSTLVSSSLSFSYSVGTKDVNLVAKFEYDPTAPGEPTSGSGQGSVDNKPRVRGDVNNDGKVNIEDVKLLVDIVLGKAEDKYNAGDINKDMWINIADVAELIKIAIIR